MTHLDIAITTRCHNKSDEDSLDLLKRFIKSSQSLSSCIVVAVDSPELAHRIDALAFDNVSTVLVSPWGFSTALNALCIKSIEMGKDKVLFASTEFIPKTESVARLNSLLHGDVFMVGAATEEHRYSPGLIENPNALQTPWNTFALVNAHKLVLTGVPLLTDSPDLHDDRGMEEVVTLALQGAIGNQAILAKVPGVWEWPNKSAMSKDELKKHDKKIKSKNSRSERQLKLLGLKMSPVQHL